MNNATPVHVIGMCDATRDQARFHRKHDILTAEGKTDRMAREIEEFKDSLFRVDSDIFALKEMRKNLRGEIESRRVALRQHLHLDD